MKDNQRFLSIVIPAFNEEANIGAAVAGVQEVLDGLGCVWEIIVVDDGSSDGTFQRVAALASSDPRVKVLCFSRNFGSHVAITAGLEHANGDAALVITADLEEPPEMVPAFVDRWAEGYEIVWGIRRHRRESLPSRLASKVFHLLFRQFGLAEYAREDVGGGFVLIDRRVLDVIRTIPERNRTIIGLLTWVGFRQGYVVYEQGQRLSGRSRWTLAKKIKLAIDSFVSFSYAPIQLVSMFGLAIAGLSFLYGLFVVVKSLISGVTVSGWPTLMATILFLSGIQLLVSGMIGEYIWRTLDESRRRPLYIVRDKINISEKNAER